jgi:hypothetical protein
MSKTGVSRQPPRARHLGVENDPDDPHNDDPCQRHLEAGARLRVRDEVADVDEATDRGEDPSVISRSFFRNDPG